MSVLGKLFGGDSDDAEEVVTMGTLNTRTGRFSNTEMCQAAGHGGRDCKNMNDLLARHPSIRAGYERESRR
ncbi:MAG: hypothetical protein ACRDRO_04920 [Pseudonocardiaceae bacterium]